eukprot:COSAG01_NODE_23216_length_823_cov_2.878453_1_plen_56_part_10
MAASLLSRGQAGSQPPHPTHRHHKAIHTSTPGDDGRVQRKGAAAQLLVAEHSTVLA